MSQAIQLSGVSLSYGDRTLLNNVTFSLNEKSRVALTGANGSGKSTLMKILTGEISSDSGGITVSKNIRTAYLPQTGIVHAGVSLYDETEKAFSRLKELDQKMIEISHKMDDESEGPLFEAHCRDYQIYHDQLEGSNYYERQQLIYSTLRGLGFNSSDMDKGCSLFSGGWQMRIALAKVLLQSPHFLLLDEPTNYLDIEAKEWLIGYLKKFRGGVLLVSHDRFFLDSLVQETVELFMGKLVLYKGNYSYYEKRRKIELEELLIQYKKQQEEIIKLEMFINRFRYNASKAAQVQSRVKMLEKIERIEIPDQLKGLQLNFPNPPHSGKIVFEMENLAKSYGDKSVFSNLNLTVTRGMKLAVTGINGAGKSTLLRILAGVESDYSGTLKLGTGLNCGYFSQEREDFESVNHSILEEMEATTPTELISKIRTLLGSFLFSGDDVFKEISILSGGEQSRLALLKLLVHPINLLILDEPTNHLDIHSKDVLLEALQKSCATVIFVSHDRYFLENLADHVIYIDEGTVRFYPGDYKYFLSQIKHIENSASEALADKKEIKTKEELSSNLTHAEQKQRRAETRKLEKERDRLFTLLVSVEEDLEENQNLLLLPEIYSSSEKAAETGKEIKELESRIVELTKEWEQAEEACFTLE